MTDERMEQIMAHLLRGGVVLAAAIVLTGGVWYLAIHGSGAAFPRGAHPPARGWRSLSAPEAVILAGLLVLIATPIARVAFALAAFAMQRDRVFMAISGIVLAILLYAVL